MKDISDNIVSLEEYKKQIDRKREVIRESYTNTFSGCTERERHLLDVIESLSDYIETLCDVIEKDAGKTVESTKE